MKTDFSNLDYMYKANIYLLASLLNNPEVIAHKSRRDLESNLFANNGFIIFIHTNKGRFYQKFSDKYWKLFNLPEAFCCPFDYNEVGKTECLETLKSLVSVLFKIQPSIGSIWMHKERKRKYKVIGIQDDYVKIQDISDHQIMPLKHFIEYMEQEDEVSEL